MFLSCVHITIQVRTLLLVLVNIFPLHLKWSGGQWPVVLIHTNGNGLPNTDSVYDRLRLSYDALDKEDVHLQLCFLYVAATFLEDKIISVYEIIQRWVGEALLPNKMPEGRLQLAYDPFEMGKSYLNLLADRCLIEPIMRGVDGQVEYFRVHDVLRDLGIRIAEMEEKFYCRVDCSLTT